MQNPLDIGYFQIFDLEAAIFIARPHVLGMSTDAPCVYA